MTDLAPTARYESGRSTKSRPRGNQCTAQRYPMQKESSIYTKYQTQTGMPPACTYLHEMLVLQFLAQRHLSHLAGKTKVRVRAWHLEANSYEDPVHEANSYYDTVHRIKCPSLHWLGRTYQIEWMTS